jgi:cardiolipin synthase A/B
MTPIWRLFALLAISLVGITSGCASLPDVSGVIGEVPAGQTLRQIVSAKGLLSPEKSKSIMERLERSVDPTDVLQRHAAVIESVSGSPLTKGNKVTLLVDGPVAYAAMFEAIQNARAQIDLESFIFEDDQTGRRFADLLLQKRTEGVQVHLIYDSLGTSNASAPIFERLRNGGIQVVEFNQTNPLKARGKWGLLHRDHRKILVIDGRVAITGGVNISEVYSSSAPSRTREEKARIPWRDPQRRSLLRGRRARGGRSRDPRTDVRIEGPAAVEFQKLFLETWEKQKGPTLGPQEPAAALKEKGDALVRAVGSTPGQTNRITFVAYVSAITFAQHSVHLTNAYFIPDEQIRKAFTDAARRGVDVIVVVPSITDSSYALRAQRYNYSKLLKSGVKVFERRGALLHAKSAVIDDVWSTVGSSNMDYWSFLSNDEVNAIILSRDFAAAMEKLFADDIAQSDEIQWKAWKGRPLSQKVKEWVAHLFLRWL